MGAAVPSGFLTSGGVRVLAHQGLAHGAPPNTLLAFRHAISAGATHLETDVHATRDGIAVISHDPDVRDHDPHDDDVRDCDVHDSDVQASAATVPDLTASGRHRRITEMTFAELARIRLGNGQVVTSLTDALTAFPAARFNIDVKATDAVAATIRSVRDCAAIDRVLITSFSQARRRAAVLGLPGVASSPSSAEFARVWAATRLGSPGLIERLLRGFVAVQVPERVGRVRIVTDRFVRRMHSAGVEVHVWTVNDPSSMIRLLDLGVDGIVTDRCDLLVDLITART